MILELSLGALALLALRKRSSGSTSGAAGAVGSSAPPSASRPASLEGGSASRFVGGGSVSLRDTGGGNDRAPSGRSTSSSSSSSGGVSIAGAVLGLLGDLVSIANPAAGRAISAGRAGVSAVGRASDQAATAAGIEAGLAASQLSSGSLGYSPSNAEIEATYGLASGDSAPPSFGLDAFSGYDGMGAGGAGDAGPNDGGTGPQ